MSLEQRAAPERTDVNPVDSNPRNPLLLKLFNRAGSCAAAQWSALGFVTQDIDMIEGSRDDGSSVVVATR